MSGILGYEILGDGPTYSAPATPTREKAIFLSSKEIDLATLVASTEVTTLPVTYLQNQRPNKVWRSTSIVDQYTLVTFAREVAANMIALVNPNFNYVRVQAASTAAGLSSPAFDSGIQSIWPSTGKPIDEDHPIFTGLLRFNNSNAYKYWKIWYYGLEYGATYYQYGRLMLNKYRQVELGIDVEYAMELAPMDEQVITEYSSVFTDTRGDTPRNMALTLSALSHPDLRDWVYGMTRYCGKSKDFVVCLDPSSTTDIHLNTMQALFGDSVAFQRAIAWHGTDRIWHVNLPLREIL